MRASTARLMNSPVRLADLTFPHVSRLIYRTRLAFIHLDNLLAFGKRDRDGRVDGYITAYLPEECLLLFFRKGEAVNAASLDTTGRQVITITEALKRMRAEVERGELAYSAAPMEQLAWMYQSCAAPVEMRTVDPGQPGAFFAAFARDKTSGILELTSNARVSYVRFDGGRYASGYFCDKPEAVAIPKFLESQFHPGADRQTPVLTAAQFPYAADLPHRRRGGQGISGRGEAPGAEGERRARGCAQGDHDPFGTARHGHTGLGRAAGGALERTHGLVAPAAGGRRGDDAGHRAQDPARGHARAPLRAAIGGLLRTPAVAGGVVKWRAPCTSWRRRSATSRTSLRARPPR